MEMAALMEALENGGFSVRQQLAQTYAAQASPSDLVAVCALFMHESENVRLGAIEIISAANFRAGMGALKAVVRAGKGDERVFAIAALAKIATAEDKDTLLPFAQQWANENDSFVQTHAKALVAKLSGAPSETPTADDEQARAVLSQSERERPKNPAELTFGLLSHQQPKRREALVRTLKHHPTPAVALADAILNADADGVRLDLVTGLGTLPPAMIAQAAVGLLNGSDESTAALLGRMLARKLKEAPEDVVAPLAPALENARKRHLQHALTTAALNDALLTLAPGVALPSLFLRADTLDEASAVAVSDYLERIPPGNWIKGLPSLLESLRRSPVRLAPLARGLSTGLNAIRPAQKAELLRLLNVALRAPDPDDLRKTHARSLATLMTPLSDVGDPLPMAIVNALEMSGEQDDILALIDLLAALGTEDAAEHLVPCLQDPDEQVRARAKDALERFPSTHVVVEVDDDGTAHVVPNYRSEQGLPLSLRDGRLVDESGTAFVLDAKGRPTAESSTKFGGCVCCTRPRALERPIGTDGTFGLPQCPATGTKYLNDGESNLIAKEHPLGGCGTCETLRPLERKNDVVTCPACGTEHIRRTKFGRTAYFPRRDGERGSRRTGQWSPMTTNPPPQPSAGGGPGGGGGGGAPPLSLDELKKQLPKAPSASELQLVEPTIGRAMAANAFLLGRMSDGTWNGSGIVVAVDEHHVAILTNRHVVERAYGFAWDELAEMHALLISGDVIPVQCVWRAQPGIDLALLVGKVENPQRLAVTPLGDGACLVGTDLFAIGNPMGLSWSYTSGACSAFRETTLDDGRVLREVQTQAPIARGSSGGGLYHKNGHLVGVLASVRSDAGVGSSAHFAIAVETVRQTLERENVQWRGASLLTRIDALT